MGTPPSTPSKRNNSELVQLLDDFSSKWELGLRLDKQELTPEARHGHVVKVGGETAAKCLSYIRLLFFKDIECLRSCLESFDTIATSLQPDSNSARLSTSAASPGACNRITSSQQQKLLALLLSVLTPHFTRIKNLDSTRRRRYNATFDQAQSSPLSLLDDTPRPLAFRPRQHSPASKRTPDSALQHSPSPAARTGSLLIDIDDDVPSQEESDLHTTASISSEVSTILFELATPPASQSSYSPTPQPFGIGPVPGPWSLSGEGFPRDTSSTDIPTQESRAKNHLPDSGYSSFRSDPVVEHVEISDTETSYGSTVHDEDGYDVPVYETEDEKQKIFGHAFRKFLNYSN